jgi:hypothetical protein
MLTRDDAILRLDKLLLSIHVSHNIAATWCHRADPQQLIP